jgi:hypothetical protein
MKSIAKTLPNSMIVPPGCQVGETFAVIGMPHKPRDCFALGFRIIKQGICKSLGCLASKKWLFFACASLHDVRPLRLWLKLNHHTIQLSAIISWQ